MTKKRTPVLHNYIQEYWQKIQSGEIVAGEKIKTIYKKLDADTKSKTTTYHFDVKAATRPIYFIERFCRQSKGAMGSPIKLELFQKAFIQSVYGFVDDNGLRKYTEVLMIVARKNGKSTLLSGLGLYELLGDHEGGPEIDCVASKKDQAKIVFNEAVHMVEQSPDLGRYIHKRKTDMYSKFNFGVFQPLSSDSNTLDGLNTSCGIIDELHSIKDRNLYDVVKQGTAARRQPLLFEITTSGLNRNGIYDSQYEYAERVLSGDVKDEHFLPVIYELDKGDDFRNEKVWIKANPGLGSIKKTEVLRANVEKAKVDSSFRPTVLCKDFNVKSVSAEAWLSWEELNNEALFTMDDVRDTYAIGGCDLSATTDLTCATLLIQKPVNDELYVLQQYFLPQSRIDYLKTTTSHEAPYETWSKRGLLTVCPGTMVDYKMVTKWFVDMREKYGIDIYKLGYDRALAQYWQQEMADYFGESVMEKVAQGPYTWTAPMKELGAKLTDKKINYNNNPILKWCLSNTAVKTTGSVESIQPVKISSVRRIDGLVSLLNAYTVYVKYKEDYENLIAG